MAEIKLQFSVVCEWSDGKNIGNIYNGFRPGKIDQFYIVNKWIWDERYEGGVEEEDFYQETRLVREGDDKEVLISSKSNLFRVKNSHTHNNYFKDIDFKAESDYRVEVSLFRKDDKLIKKGSLDYPLFVKRK